MEEDKDYKYALEIMRQEVKNPYIDSEIKRAFQISVKANKKQILKKIKYKYEKTYFCPPDCGDKENDEYGYVPYCPECDAELNDMSRCKFCHECGQKLNWN